MGYFDGIKDLFNGLPTKSASSDSPQEEGVEELQDEMSLDMDDEELISLARSWENNWHGYNTDISKKQKANRNFWLKGCEDEGEDENPDNLLFEALETFLPIATQRNPEPVVVADNTEGGEDLAGKIGKMLASLSDRLSMKLKMKRACRYWAIDLLGIAKVVWDNEREEIDVKIIKPEKIILDPEYCIDDNMKYEGYYIGERKRDRASDLVEMFPKKKSEIEDMVKGKMDSIVTYTEWWTDEYVFWTLKELVLDKTKNPNWNYKEKRESNDEFGNPITEELPEFNHFKKPEKPYAFLSVFNLGNQPHDETSLLSQNIPNQKRLNELNKQIIRNIKMMNGGMIVSGERSGLTSSQAARAGRALRDGDTIFMPTGDPNAAVGRFNQGGLPSDVYNERMDTRNGLRGIFGISGSTASGTQQEQTVRGKIIVRQQDASRIGGGVTEFLEQFADRIYNLMLQMMMVYYDKPHIASLIGEVGAQEYVELSRQEFQQVPAKFVVSVKEGSLIPKDPLTKSNQAVELAQMGMMDPISLYEALDYPDPVDQAKKMFKWTSAPQTLFQETPEGMDAVQQVEQAKQQEAMGAQMQQQQLEGAAAGLPAEMPPVNI